MDIKKDLYEQYDEILFKTLMSEVAKQEGKRLIEENERLKTDSSFEMPMDIYKHGLQTIQRAFRSKLRGYKFKAGKRIMYRFVSVVFVVVLFLVIACAAFPNLKATIFNTFLDIYETHFSFSFKESNKDASYEINIGWLPNGFNEKEEGEGPFNTWKLYLNNNGSYIHLEKSDPITQVIDSEDATITETSVQGYDATVVVSDEKMDLVWLNTDNQIVYYVLTEGISFDELMKIAENFK